MKTQAEINEIIKEKFLDMQASINILEAQIQEAGDEMNKPLIAFHIGKIYNDYKAITGFLGIFEKEAAKGE